MSENPREHMKICQKNSKNRTSRKTTLDEVCGITENDLVSRKAFKNHIDGHKENVFKSGSQTPVIFIDRNLLVFSRRLSKLQPGSPEYS